jgi:hypothetical protein
VLTVPSHRNWRHAAGQEADRQWTDGYFADAAVAKQKKN